MKKEQDDAWIRICVLPLVIGFALVYAKISMPIFKIIGWVLLIFGILTGLNYIWGWYKKHKEEVRKFLIKIYLIKDKKYGQK